MKRKTWVMLALVMAALAVFYGYRYRVQQHTDGNPPRIEMSEEMLQLSVLDSEEALLQGVTASDREDGDVTASLIVENIRLLDADGNATVSYAAFDRAGNVTKATRRVCFTDYESPRFSLTAPLLLHQSSNLDALNYIHASDLLDGDITRRIRATLLTENVISTVGEHLVEFRVTNSLGDTVKLELPLEVYAQTYQATLNLTDYLIYLPVGAAFDPEHYLSSYKEQRETISLKGGIPETLSVQVVGTVDTNTPGVYTVEYRVQTMAGENETVQTKACTRLIVVVEG